MASIKYPANERLWVSYFSQTSELMFIMTAKPARDQYVLYEIKDDKPVRLGKAPCPVDLEEEFAVNDRIRNSQSISA